MMINPRIIAAIGFAILLIITIISLRSCAGSRQAAEQAKQTSRSEAAYSTAAKVAVDKVTQRAAEEGELKEVVADAAKELANAEGSEQAIPPAARVAALRAACRLPNYRDEPACQVQPTRP